MAHRTVEARREQVRTLRDQGLSFRAIGQQLGISHELARRDARAAGLTVLTAVPDELGPPGQAFWAHATATFDFDRSEQLLLTQICRLLDRADALRTDIAEHGVMITSPKGARLANPAIAAERQVSLALGRLLGQLEIPAESGEDGGLSSTTSARARKAANARWDKERRRGPA